MFDAGYRRALVDPPRPFGSLTPMAGVRIILVVRVSRTASAEDPPKERRVSGKFTTGRQERPSYLRQNRGVKSTNRVNSSRRPASIEKLHTQV